MNDSQVGRLGGSEPAASAPTGRRHWSRAWVAGRVAVFVVWFGAVLWLESAHVFWRDEGRAWSIALQGDSVFDMLRQLQGEGHPPLWYLLLRLGHAVSGSTLVLPGMAVAVMAAAALLLLFASPFALWLSALILAGDAFVFEFAVMARNYGISALLLFVLAALYRRCRARGIWLGVVCALLALSNAHAAFLAAVFMLLWLLDLTFDGRVGWNRATGVWAANGAVTTAGLIASVVSMYPTYNDAVVGFGVAHDFAGVATALGLPASTFRELLLHRPAEALGFGPLPAYSRSLVYRWMSAVLFGSVLGLIRWPAALIAGLVSLAGLSLFFATIYAGSYRHEAVWLSFLIALYWMQFERAPGPARSLVSMAGFGCFLLLLALQVPITGAELGLERRNVPASQVRNLAQAIEARPALRHAILLPDPDYLLEAYPYYADSPIYLAREQRFGAFAHFTGHLQARLSLGALLMTAQRLCRARQVPVVLVIQQDLDTASPPVDVHEGYNLSFTATAAEIAALEQSTTALGRFTPAVTDEVFSAYALEPPCALVGWSG